MLNVHPNQKEGGRYLFLDRIEIEGRVSSDRSSVIVVRDCGQVDQIYKADQSGLATFVGPAVTYQWEK